MATPRRAPDWRPYWATGIALALALGLNFYTQNGLWFSYTLIGTALFLFLAGCVRHYRWRIPSIAVWFVGIAAGLHYVGGSLAGLHQVGGPNGLYYVFPWWDNVVHALGSAALAISAYAFVALKLPSAGRAWRVVIALSIAVLIGTLVELYEFAGFVFFSTVDQGYYTNTLLDLYYNLLGGTVGALAYDHAVLPAKARPRTRSRMTRRMVRG